MAVGVSAKRGSGERSLIFLEMTTIVVPSHARSLSSPFALSFVAFVRFLVMTYFTSDKAASSRRCKLISYFAMNCFCSVATRRKSAAGVLLNPLEIAVIDEIRQF
jgi:hypothetical protein